ncbi:Chorismate synthase [Chlamydiales bacterium SCGC AG-110-M15]|nr:Chorismate synthase [Chlamydiales bacterium SCGC AG-110-M15]
MGANTFGKQFQISTWGESHGKAIGLTIDGCPPGLEINEDELNAALEKRRPGRSPYVSPRNESDQAEILSGIFEGRTTGTPISIMIGNRDADSSQYDTLKDVYRPGHANFTYLAKYGVFDHRGGGRASARETACRVAAGYVAQKVLDNEKIKVLAHLKSVGVVKVRLDEGELLEREGDLNASSIFCADSIMEHKMRTLIEAVREDGDSLGGVVEVCAYGLPVGLGEPIYDKLEARIAQAMMSIPASKGVEVGMGFAAAEMRGSEHNDRYIPGEDGVQLESNRCGGILGGISTGTPIVVRVAFKPASSIRKVQKSVDLDGKVCEVELPEGGRHDPCVAIRAVPVVEAMLRVVLADFCLLKGEVSKMLHPIKI